MDIEEKEVTIMSEKYLKVILISAVGGLYMIAYSLFYIGTRIGGNGIDRSNYLKRVGFGGCNYVAY